MINYEKHCLSFVTVESAKARWMLLTTNEFNNENIFV